MANSFENIALAEVRMLSGDGDPYGTYLGAHFDCAEILYRMGADVPAAWGYRPSPMLRQDLVWSYSTGEGYGLDTTAGLLWDARDGLTRPEYVAQLTHAGDVLARLVSLCKMAGLDY